MNYEKFYRICSHAFAAILGVQIWTTYLIATSSEQILKDLAQTHVSSIEEEKVRQEAIAAKIQNARQGLFWAGLAGNISAAVAIIAALSGAWIGLSQYLSLSLEKTAKSASPRHGKSAKRTPPQH